MVRSLRGGTLIAWAALITWAVHVFFHLAQWLAWGTLPEVLLRPLFAEDDVGRAVHGAVESLIGLALILGLLRRRTRLAAL